MRLLRPTFGALTSASISSGRPHSQAGTHELAPQQQPLTPGKRLKILRAQDLFANDTFDLAVDRSFATANRTQLDAHSWIEVVPA